MTERSIIRTTGEHDIAVAPHEEGVLLSLLPWREAPAHIGEAVQTGPLLAAIDRADPDAMRAYLRERSDYLDSPDESCSTLEEMLPANLAAEAARFRAVPEADSPEDVDETPDPYADARAAGKQIGETMRAFRDSYIEAMKL